MTKRKRINTQIDLKIKNQFRNHLETVLHKYIWEKLDNSLWSQLSYSLSNKLRVELMCGQYDQK